MSNDTKKKLQAAILKQVKEGHTSSIGEIARKIRVTNPRFRAVPDFDFRANVLSLIALGQLETRPKLQVAKKQVSE